MNVNQVFFAMDRFSEMASEESASRANADKFSGQQQMKNTVGPSLN